MVHTEVKLVVERHQKMGVPVMRPERNTVIIKPDPDATVDEILSAVQDVITAVDSFVVNCEPVGTKIQWCICWIEIATEKLPEKTLAALKDGVAPRRRLMYGRKLALDTTATYPKLQLALHRDYDPERLYRAPTETAFADTNLLPAALPA